MVQKILFTGKIQTFCELEEILVIYDFKYFSDPNNVIGYSEKIDLVIFETSEKDIILGLRKQRKNLPILLINKDNNHLSKTKRREYESHNIDILTDLSSLAKKVESYF